MAKTLLGQRMPFMLQRLFVLSVALGFIAICLAGPIAHATAPEMSISPYPTYVGTNTCIGAVCTPNTDTCAVQMPQGTTLAQQVGSAYYCYTPTEPGSYTFYALDINNGQSLSAVEQVNPALTTATTSTSTIGQSSSSSSNASICSILGIYTDVVDIVFVLGLMLMILGGALYAGGNLLPGTTKGSMQGYGMGMIIGGAIGVMIAVLSPYILQALTGYSANALMSSFSTLFSCGAPAP